MRSWPRTALAVALALCACDDGIVHLVRYPSGSIRERWIEKGPAGGPTVRDGLFQSYSADGRLRSEFEYRRGRKSGAARMWDAKGKQSFAGEYRDDFLVRETLFDASGAASERTYAIRTTAVRALGPGGDSLSAAETCAWAEADGGSGQAGSPIAAGKAPVKHGLCAVAYADGGPMSTRYYRSSVLHGPFKAWHSGGAAWLEGGYRHGAPAGNWRRWSPGGKPEWSAFYAEGRRHGAWEEWYADGGRKCAATYRKGRPEGEYREWYPGGGLRLQVSYSAGKREGKEEAWYPDGARLYSAAYAGGRLEGDFRQWYPGGELRLHCRFAGGKKEGASRVWHRGGRLQESAHYKRGRLEGPYRAWSREGALMAVKEYRGGALAADRKAEALMELLGADGAGVPMGMLGFYWGMARRECLANLGLLQASGVRDGDEGITAGVIAFADRKPARARIRLGFNAQGELWAIGLELRQESAADFFPICENLEIELGGGFGTAGLRKEGDGARYSMFRRKEWGRFTAAPAFNSPGGPTLRELPVLSAEGFSPGSAGWFRFSLENHLYREYADPANGSISPPDWRRDAFLAGR